MYKKTCFFVSLAAMAFSYNAYAIKFGETVVSSAVITSNKAQLSDTKEVALMNVQLNPKLEKAILNFNPVKKMQVIKDETLPSQFYDTKIDTVPILDQGMHGSCVTFANTAAIDALLGKGDYISQLCQLELGSYFEGKGYLNSGWEGALAPQILDQMLRFGIINKDNQNTHACVDRNYPTKHHNKGTPISLDQYRNYSEDLSESFLYAPILSIIQRMQDDLYDGDKILMTIKKELAQQPDDGASMITFGVMLPPNSNAACSQVSACAKHHKKNDTWAITKDLGNGFIGGHEMIIVGYDDDAIAIDAEGNQYHGLLILRNSWGNNVGDNGNFYMTYDFFKKYVIEVNQILTEKF